MNGLYISLLIVNICNNGFHNKCIVIHPCRVMSSGDSATLWGIAIDFVYLLYHMS